MTARSTGLLYGIAAYALWGSLPIFWKQLDSLAPATIIAHRIVCGFLTLIPILFLRKRWSDFLSMLRCRRSLLLGLLTGLTLAVNWLIYLWATLNGKVVEVALGYYILPLIYVLMGCLLLGERPNKLETASFIVAAAGVALQTYGIGAPPWSALGVAFTFAIYGIVKKKTHRDGNAALSLELITLTPIALCFLLIPSVSRGDAWGDGQALTLFFLCLTGVATVTPLLLFAAAAKRIQLSTIGMLQFIAPTGQFLIGWLYYREQLNNSQLTSFALIWLAISLYSISAIRKNKSQPL